MRADGVEDRLIEDAVELLLDSLDVLLERVASRPEFAPKAGSPNGLPNGMTAIPMRDVSALVNTCSSELLLLLPLTSPRTPTSS
ncbi:hypothetical protein [Rhodococcus globerulus]|jgi:hypothetical protein|uniref:hypothetical protein n=1 Tax=Rhodococcus globerulus TaxID=33008 RepID=UPI001F381F29|nr:hypothetical protein [Rhodococcus globerulus]MCE4267704.1 hypothetical protein [Rhodococcus globerulus]